jgi:hypothetical protein
MRVKLDKKSTMLVRLRGLGRFEGSKRYEFFQDVLFTIISRDCIQVLAPQRFCVGHPDR